MAKTTTKVKVKDNEGKEQEVEIEVDDGTAEGTINVDGKKYGLRGLKRGKDGKKIKGKTDHWLKGELDVSIIINCDAEPPTIRIIVTNKKGEVLKDDTYTFTHEEQDKLVNWIKGLKVPVFVAALGILDGAPGLTSIVASLRGALEHATLELARDAGGWEETSSGLELLAPGGARVTLAGRDGGLDFRVATPGPADSGGAAAAGLAKLPHAEEGGGGLGTVSGDWIPFGHCDDFYENTTGNAVVVTITVCNSSEDSTLALDIGGTTVVTIPAGKCKTIVVEIPAGGSLHAGGKGRYRR